jgi:hypothetical protein
MPNNRDGIKRMPASLRAGTYARYVVQEGDNYFYLADKYYGNEWFAASLAEANENILLVPGMTVLLPSPEDLRLERNKMFIGASGTEVEEKEEKKVYCEFCGGSAWYQGTECNTCGHPKPKEEEKECSGSETVMSSVSIGRSSQVPYYFRPIPPSQIEREMIEQDKRHQEFIDNFFMDPKKETTVESCSLVLIIGVAVIVALSVMAYLFTVGG